MVKQRWADAVTLTHDTAEAVRTGQVDPGDIADEIMASFRAPVQQTPVPTQPCRTVEEVQRRWVRVNIGYIAASGYRTSRSVDPVGFQRRRRVVPHRWCHLRRAGRIFRLDQARLTTRPSAQDNVDETLGWVLDALRDP